jgi:hypothetical protein
MFKTFVGSPELRPTHHAATIRCRNPLPMSLCTGSEQSPAIYPRQPLFGIGNADHGTCCGQSSFDDLALINKGHRPCELLGESIEAPGGGCDLSILFGYVEYLAKPPAIVLVAARARAGAGDESCLGCAAGDLREA